MLLGFSSAELLVCSLALAAQLASAAKSKRSAEKMVFQLSCMKVAVVRINWNSLAF